MEKKKRIAPKFGPLSGMRVIGSGSLIAMPFAASMLAEFGAEVIQIERPDIGDNYRYFPPVIKNGEKSAGTSWMQEARNRLSMTLELNLGIPEAKEIFFELIRQSDVYMENMVWLDKLGIRDEDLMEINPKLIIVHISGFGSLPFGGVPEICSQGSYDMIGQAFSGFALFNGYPDRAPLIVKPSLSDYTTAMFALFGVLTAYINVRETGKGQVVDISQFEAQAKLMRDAFTMSSTGAAEVSRCGSKAIGFQPWDLFTSRDNEYVAIGAVGPSVYYRFLDTVGFCREKYTYENVSSDKAAVESPLGREFAEKVTQWCLDHTADEIETAMRKNRVPCSKVNTATDCMKHPQYLLRDDFITYRDQTVDKDITAFGVFPKFSDTPGAVWRGAPALGQDTDNILKTLLGYSDGQIAQLHEKGII